MLIIPFRFKLYFRNPVERYLGNINSWLFLSWNICTFPSNIRHSFTMQNTQVGSCDLSEFGIHLPDSSLLSVST